jgi:hypothetical protein
MQPHPRFSNNSQPAVPSLPANFHNVPRHACLKELAAAKAAAKEAETTAEKLAAEKTALLQELAFGRAVSNGGELLRAEAMRPCCGLSYRRESSSKSMPNQLM